ncbi:hypothetical protein [Actinomadura sediminis]|uniref:DUF3995 domain-containing protein n=1 Tax=Actinomadura sediminis TaxID=1038904 RepID=A0ABW3F055_9ACTN
MSNGARHALGALIGVVLTPLIAAGLLYGTHQMHRSGQRVAATFGDEAGSERWIGSALLLCTAVLLALAVAPRVSPLASLIPGVVLTGVGGVWVADPGWMLRQELVADLLPARLELAYIGIIGPYGIFLLLGLLLLVASVMPGRWTSTAARSRHAGPPPAPMGASGPPPLPGTARPGAGPQPHAEPGPFAPPYSPPPAPQGPQPQQPQQPQQQPGAVPFGHGEERPDPSRGQGEGGEWTRMYGDDDLRGR